MLKKIINKLKFKAGIYELRAIVKIAKGGIYISNRPIKYQPDAGIRYELTRQEWFFWTYVSFPQYSSKEVYTKKFLDEEIYYDYFKEVKRPNPDSLIANDKTFYYELFKNNKPSGMYFRVALVPNLYRNSDSGTRNCWYDSFFISPLSGLHFWKNNEGFRYLGSEITFAINAISERDNFENRKIDFDIFKILNQPDGVYVLEKKLKEFNL